MADEIKTEEELDDEIKRLEEEIKAAGGSSSYGSPPPEKKEGLFKFFKHILELKDSTKVANLSTQELGAVKMGVRHYKQLALYADVENLDKVSKYLEANAEIISKTSMAKKGFWAELLVTQIKKEKKTQEPKAEVKKKWFSSNKTIEGE